MVEVCASVMVEACDGERYCDGGSLCRIGEKLSRVCQGWRTAAAIASLSSIVRGNPPQGKTVWPDATPGPRR